MLLNRRELRVFDIYLTWKMSLIQDLLRVNLSQLTSWTGATWNDESCLKSSFCWRDQRWAHMKQKQGGISSSWSHGNKLPVSNRRPRHAPSSSLSMKNQKQVFNWNEVRPAFCDSSRGTGRWSCRRKQPVCSWSSKCSAQPPKHRKASVEPVYFLTYSSQIPQTNNLWPLTPRHFRRRRGNQTEEGLLSVLTSTCCFILESSSLSSGESLKTSEGQERVGVGWGSAGSDGHVNAVSVNM